MSKIFKYQKYRRKSSYYFHLMSHIGTAISYLFIYVFSMFKKDIKTPHV